MPNKSEKRNPSASLRARAKSEKIQKTIETPKRVRKVLVSLKADVVNTKGKVVGDIELPKEFFGVTVNKALIAQAVRVYLANQRRGTSSTKTRGEVQGSTRKIYQQKGTGRARHGSKRAPIFVHGGIVSGPKPRDFSLTMPAKMRKKALSAALSAKYSDGTVKIITGLDKIEPKTKIMTGIFKNLALDGKRKSVALVLPSKIDNVEKAARNIDGVDILFTKQLNTYDVIKRKYMLFMKEAVQQFVSKGENSA